MSLVKNIFFLVSVSFLLSACGGGSSEPLPDSDSDQVGNAQLSGPGGNELDSWYYGVDRPKINIHRTAEGLCIFDNGLVSVVDMNNTRDSVWESTGGKNHADDIAFPPYMFECDEEPVNTHREISDEVGVWTYSTLNDAMFYGEIVHEAFVRFLGEPPLDDKIRLRVHYGHQWDLRAFWDGAYANFSDAYGLQYSTASLDVIAHEIAHGVLNRISNMHSFENELSTDARTLHEAFSDISGVMIKYHYTGLSNDWRHGAESLGATRELDQIQTEPGAIESFLDYDQAGPNYYRRIGMITYPFYLLSQQWGLEEAYSVYLSAARNCWSASTSLSEAAACVKQQAGLMDLSEQDVEEAFKAVKIKLFDEGVLSHFHLTVRDLRVEFSDNSQSSNSVTSWHWDFGDGESSIEQNPEHVFAGPGTYQITLTVTDQSDDQDAFTRTVTVSE